MFNIILTAGYITAYPLLDIFVKVTTIATYINAWIYCMCLNILAWGWYISTHIF